jgi:hypothetical protein
VDVRILTRLGLGLLVVVATGCETLRGFRSQPPAQPFPPDAPAPPPTPGGTNLNPNTPNGTPTGGAAPTSVPGGVVVSSGTASGSSNNTRQTQAADGAPLGVLPQPRPLPAPPGWQPGQPIPPSAGQQLPLAAPPGSPAGTDPHLRAYPTVTGSRAQLAPWETPADRMVDLSKHLELVLNQNRDLQARIKDLETQGLAREQALAEAMREIDAITADAARTRGALQTQILTLQGRVKQLEEEDIVFLRAVIDALGKLLPEKKP